MVGHIHFVSLTKMIYLTILMNNEKYEFEFPDN
jgi:hypothetical protein